jgi:hypothetical protein
VELESDLDSVSASGLQRFVVAFGVDRVPRMTQELPGENQWSARTPTDSLRALVAEGAINSTHLLGWWTSLDAFTEQAGRYVGNIGMLAFLNVPQKDIRTVIPSSPDWEPTRNRALWFDRDHWTTPAPFVPYTPAGEAALRTFFDVGAPVT